MLRCCRREMDGYPDIGDGPFQPRSQEYPKRAFGISHVVFRSFQATWYDNYPWLHWDVKRERAFCYTCVKAARGKLLLNSKTDAAFISSGFQNWKDGPRGFSKHEASDCHKEAVEKLITLPESTGHVGELLNSQLAVDRKQNREKFLLILRNIKFLARQGLPLRGASQDGGEVDSNFHQLLAVFSEFEPSLQQWLEKKKGKYTSADMQNEMLKIMAHQILREVARTISGKKFAIMVDETTDCSCTEQCVIVIRWVDSDLSVHEEFIGYYAVATANAATIVATITDALVRMQVELSDCRGQCYDGAATMSGSKNGVATQLLAKEPRALYTHCYGHALNLACQDMMREVKLVRDALDVTFEFSKLLKYSAKRTAEYQRLKNDLAPEEAGFRTLCPTRWTVRAASLNSILVNYKVLQECLDSFTELAKGDREMSAKCNGVRSQFGTFNFLFGVALGKKVLSLADNLSKSLQSATLSASEGQVIAKATIDSLLLLRCDGKFEEFWKYVIEVQQSNDVSEPQLPRKKSAPARLQVGTGAPSFPSTVEDHYRPVYYASIDTVIQAIRQRFDQEGYHQYRNLEELLLKGCNGLDITPELTAVAELYKDDLKPDLLRDQLSILHASLSAEEIVPTIQSIVAHLKSLSSRHLFMSEVVVLLQLILISPATNATSERSFSALRRLKTYLRSTMTQKRLNHCAILHVRKEDCDRLDLVAVANDFVGDNEYRKGLFGKF